MQDDLKSKYQFFKSLVEINSMFGDNQEFVTRVKQELFSDKVYIYGMIILDHHRLKKEPNDGFTYPIIFEKYGILADIVISSPFIMILISITIIMFYINKK